MSSPVTSPDAPPADTHSRTPKPLFNDEEMEDLDERLEDQSIMSRCDIQQFSAYDALILVFYWVPLGSGFLHQVHAIWTRLNTYKVLSLANYWHFNFNISLSNSREFSPP